MCNFKLSYNATSFSASEVDFTYKRSTTKKSNGMSNNSKKIEYLHDFVFVVVLFVLKVIYQA